ncbi:MAG: phospholipase D family protein [Candidatus Caldarchaeum sp.]|uniref:Phospholipase D family protein n=1 Tax=Caldiarchaeum subterraneum TaxID=311458 RepID=A0A7C4E0F9_CALS0
MNRSVVVPVVLLLIGLFAGLAAGLTLSPRERVATTFTTTATAVSTRVLTATASYTVTSTTTATQPTTLTSTRTVTVTTSIIPEIPQLYNHSGVAVCFSRPMVCESMLETLINAAQRRILVAVYVFTNDRLANALIAAHNRGVDVKVVLEAESAEIRGSEYQRLKEAGLDIRLDGNSALMHHKFMVIDDRIVATGSYNWSGAAEEANDENLVAILSEDVAKQFVEEFDRLWSIASQ